MMCPLLLGKITPIYQTRLSLLTLHLRVFSCLSVGFPKPQTEKKPLGMTRKRLIFLRILVGLTGLEPATPTMSKTTRNGRNHLFYETLSANAIGATRLQTVLYESNGYSRRNHCIAPVIRQAAREPARWSRTSDREKISISTRRLCAGACSKFFRWPSEKGDKGDGAAKSGAML